MTILILGGTADAINATKQLTDFLQQHHINTPCVYSLAGVTKNPNTPDGVKVRSGGFGGVQGIIDYIAHHDVRHVFDFTHPYATQISAHINQALYNLSHTGYPIPLYRYNRPAWQWDTYIHYRNTVCDIAAATAHIQGNIFVALGAKDAPLFLHHTGNIIVRSMRPVSIANGTCIVAPPPADIKTEQALFDTHNFTAVICKDSGTDNGYHKIAIAKHRHIPVYMLSRPCIESVTYDNTYTGTNITAIVRAFIQHVQQGI